MRTKIIACDCISKVHMGEISNQNAIFEKWKCLSKYFFIAVLTHYSRSGYNVQSMSKVLNCFFYENKCKKTNKIRRKSVFKNARKVIQCYF